MATTEVHRERANQLQRRVNWLEEHAGIREVKFRRLDATIEQIVLRCLLRSKANADVLEIIEEASK